MGKKKRNHSGVTLTEVLITIAIVGILASVASVSLSGAKQKAKDSSALQTATSVAPLVYKCLKSQYKNTNGDVTVRYTPYAASGTGTPPLDLCAYLKTPDGNGSDTTNTDTTVTSFSKWPDISGSGWKGDFNSGVTTISDASYDGFYFCPTSGSEHTGSSHPTSAGGYDNGAIGGDRQTGNFCFLFKNGTKYIWCTENGCKKQGF